MALPKTFPPEHHPKKQPSSKSHKKQLKQQPNKSKPPSFSSPWDQFKNLFTCKQLHQAASLVHDPSSTAPNHPKNGTVNIGAAYVSKLVGSSCSSICTFKDAVVVPGNTRRVIHSSSPESSSLGQETRLINRKPVSSTARPVRPSGRSNSNATYMSSSSRGLQLSKFSGCYECRMIVEPNRYAVPRSTACACSYCGELFPKKESLELHQAVRHAVSELDPDDSGRNIVEIIFKSSWMKKDISICNIERILKVHNAQRTIQRFEDCRDAVKARATNSAKKNPRCAADGNELLRFHCTTLACTLGACGSSSLCGSIPGCGVCTIIRHGFQGRGVKTTAGSGRANDSLHCTDGRRAMLVCRVIAGRVKRVVADAAAEAEQEEALSGGAIGSYDSVAGSAGMYTNLEELTVYNPRAILPCFVVIYKVVHT